MDYSNLNQSNHRHFSLSRRLFVLGATASIAGAVGHNVSAEDAGLNSKQNAHSDDKLPSSSDSTSSKPILLRPRFDQDLLRIRIEMDAKGNVNVPDNPLVSRKSKKRLPITSDAVFDYEERYRRPADADASSIVTVAERYYHEASQDSTIDRNHQHASLRESVRQTIVRRESLPETIYATEDYFRHDELNLLRMPVASVSVDRMLPEKPLRAGDQYAPENDTIVSLLNLTSVEDSDLIVEVVSIDDQSAKFEFKGKIEASVEGVPTRLQTIGKMTFDRRLGTCTWLTMAIHETREIGKAEPGFDVAATIKMVRQPLERPIALPANPPSIAIERAVPQDRLYVELVSREVGASMLMDRRWRMMGDVPGSAMLRMIENDRSIAQCDLRPLAKLEPGRQWTLEAFQKDCEKSLGGQLSQMIEADQRLSESGLRVLRVVAQGEVQGVPIQWVMLHFSDDSGHRVLATFTMDGDSIDEFAGSDVQLASTMRLIEQATTDTKTESELAGGGIEPGQSVADVATKSPKKQDSKVQSASDLR